MANISDKVAQIREATYGKEVRESIASGIEDINTEVESTTQRQTTLETDMADAKREAEEAAVRANTAAGDAEDITEALAVWEDYDPDADYIPMNKVTYQGSCYINLVACKGVLPTNQTNWLKIASKGDQGVPGPMPNIVVGNTTTLLPGNSASVVRRAGSPDSAPILDFEIPRGMDGQGTGDMVKVDYDSNNDGKVNAADIADTVPDNTITDAMLSDAAGQIKARFESHTAETAAKHITESGSNANGNYIKFDNGTMICYSNSSAISDVAVTTAFGSIFRSTTLNLTYAGTFVGAPAVSLHLRQAVGEVMWIGNTFSPADNGNTIVRFCLLSAESVAAGNPNIKYIAIGRWKA